MLTSSPPPRPGLGHITTAYLASHFVADATTAHFQSLLRNTTADYLAGVATWADTIRYTKWGRFTSNFHFIDAKDAPPLTCNVDMARDCKVGGCVVTALHNYTQRALDPRLPFIERQQAAKFVVHFVGDMHQPLHAEDVARGGNSIHVLWRGGELNLHHVWDTSIAEKFIGGVRGPPYRAAREWADRLAAEIREGKFADLREGWLHGVNIEDPVATALGWATEANKYICSHGRFPGLLPRKVREGKLTVLAVLPEGPDAIVGQELSGDYYEKAAPVIEIQVARAGYRMAAWLDAIARGYAVRAGELGVDEL